MDLDEKEYAVEIMNTKLVEENREKILNQIKSARKNFKKGNFKRGSIKELHQDLEND